MDTGAVQGMVGVATQARGADFGQWVISYTVSVSHDASVWTPVDGGFIFAGKGPTARPARSVAPHAVSRHHTLGWTCAAVLHQPDVRLLNPIVPRTRGAGRCSGAKRLCSCGGWTVCSHRAAQTLNPNL